MILYYGVALELQNQKALEDFCMQILSVDDFIRFSGLANMKGKLVAEAYRKGLVPLLTKKKQNYQPCSLL